MAGAEPAAVADAAVTAEQQQGKLPGKIEKSFFAMSDKVKLQKIKEFGQDRLNMLINDHADDFYNVQSEMVMKADVSGRKTSCIAEAIKAQTDHLLGFIMPGQVMMLLKEDKLENELASVKADLTNILSQLSYYKVENKQIKALVDTSNHLVRSMSEKSEEHIKVIRQMQNDAAATKAEVIGLRREIYLLRATDRGQRPAKTDQDQKDETNQDQSNSGGRGGRGSSRGGRGKNYWGPNGSQRHPEPAIIPHITGTNAAFDPNSTSNKFHMDGKGTTPSQRREQAKNNNNGNGNGNRNGDETDMGMDHMSDNNQNNRGFQDGKKSRNKNKNKQPETEPMTKKQLRYAKEIIIHKVPSQKEGDYKDDEEFKVKEAEILYNLLEELSPDHLNDHGVVVNIKKDIDYMDRFDKHYDEEHYGMAPIRLRFYTVKMCNKVIQAAKRAGCLKGRRPSDFGKYAIPKKYNNAGILNDKADEEAERLAGLRPAFYFRPSLPKEERLEKEEERKIRNEKKVDPDTKAFRERRQVALGKRVKFGKSRNFGQGEADIASAKSVQDRENHFKEIREKKAAKEKEREERERLKEKERLDNLKVNNQNFPLGPKPGSGGPFENLKPGDNQEGSFHSASSSPAKELIETKQNE